MLAAKLVHELLPERGAALFEQLGGYELDRGFGQAVARPLASSRILTGEQAQLDESLESVGENI